MSLNNFHIVSHNFAIVEMRHIHTGAHHGDSSSHIKFGRDIILERKLRGYIKRTTATSPIIAVVVQRRGNLYFESSQIVINFGCSIQMQVAEFGIKVFCLKFSLK